VAKMAQCGECGCLVLPKTRLPEEECPLEGTEKRWPIHVVRGGTGED
jgi:hypothetical protein